ncbi:hypothetical protein [Streptomyces sp. NPDC058371]|uniref:hypothetical protein n=1 Tax=Streptomyces sp. NPDC058371 TaxID=3346463 RepID=UPI003668DCCB
MAAFGAGADDDGGVRAGAGVWVPGLVNLGLGVPAMVPLYLLWWLLTEYLPMDCRSVEDAARSGSVNCNYTTLDHAGVVMFLAAVTGALIVALVLVVDLLLPLRRGARLGPWLGMAALIPVPFAVCVALAR